MNILKVLKTSGYILIIEALLLVLPMSVGFCYGEFDLWYAYIIPIVILLCFGGLLTVLPLKKNNFYTREGFMTVGLCWIFIALFGCLPFVISGIIPSFIDAFFETVSGFTTTGATVLTSVETLPKGILFWRSLTHFLGGMGILVFMLAVLPKTYGNDIHLYRAESTGVTVSKIVSKMKATALILYVIYVCMTVVEVIMLLIGGEMNLFESVCYSFATAGCGGFAVRDASVGCFGVYSQTVITIFMFLFSINFTIHYLVLVGKVRQAFQSDELRWYIVIVAVAIAIVTINVLPVFNGDFWTSLNQASFQVVSIVTTTGFTTTHFELWPNVSLLVLLGLMICGSMSGSTGGGLKVCRVNILAKTTLKDLNSAMRPNKVSIVRYEGKVLSASATRNVTLYFVLYTVILFVSVALVSFFERNTANGLLENFSMSISAFSNIGPGLGKAFASCKGFSVGSKLVFCFDMLCGRLEIFPILVFLVPSVWRYK